METTKRLDNIKTLLVDDDENILLSFRRQLRKKLDIHIATSGKEALQILAEQGDFSVVVSDMQMPQMDGIELLSSIKSDYPHTMRIMLTGNANLDVAIDAINNGNIFRFLNKPVSSESLLQSINDAREVYNLRKNQTFLNQIIQTQNTYLKDMNNSLEQKVAERTVELKQLTETLQEKNIDLKQHYLESVTSLSRVIELRQGILAKESRYIARTSARLAKIMGLSDEQEQDILVAGLLLQIGKMVLPDKLLGKPLRYLQQFELNDYFQHATHAKALLKGLPKMSAPANLIYHQYERYNGAGIPSGISGEKIPLGARILAIVRDYFSYTEGLVTGKNLLNDDVIQQMIKKKGKVYDPEILDLFIKHFVNLPKKRKKEIDIEWFNLEEGMYIINLSIKDICYYKNNLVTTKLLEDIGELRETVGDNIVIRIADTSN